MKRIKNAGWRELGVVSLFILLIATWAAVDRRVFGWEMSSFSFINGWSNTLRPLFLVVTQFGNYWALFAITLGAIAFKKYRLALRIFGNGTLAFFLTELYLKHVVQRLRPEYLLSGVHVREFQPGHFGFPSAHAAVATALAITLWPLFPGRWKWLAVAWIVLVSLSRVYLGVHLPLDVIGGVAAGLVAVGGTKLVHGKLKFVRKITHLKLTD